MLPRDQRGSRRSGRSTSRTGCRRRAVPFWRFVRSGICGGELRIGRAEAGVAAAAARDQDLVPGRGPLQPVAEVVAEQVRPYRDLASIAVGTRSGASGARTRDLVNAIHALSQLSYGPSKGVIRCKVYRRPLAILGWA